MSRGGTISLGTRLDRWRTPHTHTLPASVILICIPQVFVESLKLDIYQHELAIGKLFLIRRRAGEDNSNEATRVH